MAIRTGYHWWGPIRKNFKDKVCIADQDTQVIVSYEGRDFTKADLVAVWSTICKSIEKDDHSRALESDEDDNQVVPLKTEEVVSVCKICLGDQYNPIVRLRNR